MAFPKHPYPPAGFECEYKHCCPHMSRISTQWIFGEYRRYEAARAQLWSIIESLKEQCRQYKARIAALERENALLAAKYQALHQRQFKSASNGIKRPSQTPVAETDAGQANSAQRTRGARRGHPGWFRPHPQAYDHTIDVPAPAQCPHCQNSALEPSDQSVEHCKEDIVIVQRPTTTLFRHAALWCPQCQKTVIAPVSGQPAADLIGPTAKSTAMYLHHVIGISYRKTQRVMRELFGMKYAVASALRFDEQAARNGKPLYEDLREKLRACAYIHADETHWREDCNQGYYQCGVHISISFWLLPVPRPYSITKTPWKYTPPRSTR